MTTDLSSFLDSSEEPPRLVLADHRMAKRFIKTLSALGLAAGLLQQQESPSWAAETETDAFQFFQEERIGLATRQEQSPEEAPSIVSVVGRLDIERYGARDLADILHLVPGFEFGVDVFSVAGLDFRGIWVHEGKALLMINGVTMNDFAFGNNNFFGSIPAALIEKVEIVRGPGSALYGGFAEVAVINVITRQPETLHGMQLSGNVGALGNGGVAHQENMSYGSAAENLKMAVHVGYGTQPLSQRDYVDFSGNRLTLSRDNASREWRDVIAQASAKHLSVGFTRTSFTYGAQDGFGAVIPPVNGIDLEKQNNTSQTLNAKYSAKISDHLSLEPLVEYNQSNTETTAVNPASVIGNFEGPGATLWRYRGELLAVYDTLFNSKLTAGGGYIRDSMENIQSDGTPGVQLSDDPDNIGTRVYTESRFGLLQYVQKWRQLGLTLGGRYEDTSFGNAFAPRAGLTYVQDAFNAKLLYGRAFRIPLPWQAYLRGAFSGYLKPEIADTTEMEVGYKLTPHVSVKANLFFIDISRPIVYVGQTNSYVNLGRNQSEGAESELRIHYTEWGGFLNASYATPGPNTSPGFRTASKKQFVGISPLKVAAGTYYRQGKMEYSPSIIYLSPRAGQSQEGALNGTLDTTDYHALALVNMNVIAHDILKDLDINVSINNLFDAQYVLLQPYYGGHAPLPAQDRQFTLGITWRL